eukprot:1161420-Pelagomonas_calceolata.AAC.1
MGITCTKAAEFLFHNAATTNKSTYMLLFHFATGQIMDCNTIQRQPGSNCWAPGVDLSVQPRYVGLTASVWTQHLPHASCANDPAYIEYDADPPVNCTLPLWQRLTAQPTGCNIFKPSSRGMRCQTLPCQAHMHYDVKLSPAVLCDLEGLGLHNSLRILEGLMEVEPDLSEQMEMRPLTPLTCVSHASFACLAA